jgi:hypothetical protein
MRKKYHGAIRAEGAGTVYEDCPEGIPVLPVPPMDCYPSAGYESLKFFSGPLCSKAAFYFYLVKEA